MADNQNIIKQILDALPHRTPFRFIDEILKIDEETVISAYRFRENEFFYSGHFPENPITPGVILIETMAQAGVAAHGLYLLLKNRPVGENPGRIVPLFVFADGVEFSGIVRPGERVIVTGKKKYFRRGNIKSEVSIHREGGEPVCQGILTGTGMEQS